MSVKQTSVQKIYAVLANPWTNELGCTIAQFARDAEDEC